MIETQTADELIVTISENHDSDFIRRESLRGVAKLIEGEKYEEFILQLRNSLDEASAKIAEIDFDGSNDILVIFSGKSRFIAELLWKATTSRLPPEHPVAHRAKTLGLDDLENAALYGKYDETQPGKFKEQQQLMDQGYGYIRGKAENANLVDSNNGNHHILLFEEYSNTDSKVLKSITNLRKNNFITNACVVSGMTEDDRDYFRRDVEVLSADQLASEQFLIVGSRDHSLHNIMYRLAMVRSSQAESVLNRRSENTPETLKSDTESRQALRDLLRIISLDVTE